MEENKELSELLERLEKSNQQQAKFAKLQCIFSAVAAICCAVVLVAVIGILPKFNAMVGQVDTVLTNVEQVSQQLVQADWAGVMENLENVTDEMAQADLAGIAGDVNDLVKTSQVGVEEALGKLNSLDLEGLNKAISDLSAVVEPLAKFFGRF